MILSDSFDKNGNFKEALNMHIKEAVEKVIFFLLHRPTRAKYYPQTCLKQTGLFLKNNKPKPLIRN